MPDSLTGRLRVEFFVWALDQRLQDLPRRTRISCRREVRQNLLAAARESGAAEALRGMGSANVLAREYLSAEYGDRPRPHWIAAAVVAVATPVVLTLATGHENDSAEAAIRAVDPHASGTFVVPGVAFLQRATVYSFAGGHASVTGGDWTPLLYVLLVVAVIIAGRLWRARFTSSRGVRAELGVEGEPRPVHYDGS